MLIILSIILFIFIVLYLNNSSSQPSLIKNESEISSIESEISSIESEISSIESEISSIESDVQSKISNIYEVPHQPYVDVYYHFEN